MLESHINIMLDNLNATFKLLRFHLTWTLHAKTFHWFIDSFQYRVYLWILKTSRSIAFTTLPYQNFYFIMINLPWISIKMQHISLTDLNVFEIVVLRILQSNWLRVFLTTPNCRFSNHLYLTSIYTSMQKINLIDPTALEKDS